jgi:hypothetical protein
MFSGRLNNKNAISMFAHLKTILTFTGNETLIFLGHLSNQTWKSLKNSGPDPG